MEQINVLWTGGFDSTFRVCQLSLLEVGIQPYYISLKKRSEPNELKAIAKITEFINSNKEVKCRLLPLIIIHYSDVKQDKKITDSFDELNKEFGIGYQYDFLARFAKQYNLILEVGFESDPTGRVDKCFEKHGTINESALILSGGQRIEYCEVDHNRSSEDFVNIFGNYHFGLPQFRMTKLQAIDLYKEIGYEKVIPMTWFCAYPLMGKPCGLCSPCSGVVKAKMGYRLPPGSRILYKVFKANAIGRYLDIRLKKVFNMHWRKSELSDKRN
ncbi:MAG: hypothetical protein JW965_00700 [Bacteroidales bacterium]|nr:hypothetical protein [Bacteroidales bacterium]